jgi:hypothetical protein
MGWMSSEAWPTRKALKDYLKSGREFSPGVEILGSGGSGNELWMAIKGGETSYLVLFLLGSCGYNEWGYKDMTESMGPYYYGCPLKLLDLVPETNPEWRKDVREHHGKRKAEAKAKRELKKKLRVGARLRLREGCNPQEVVISSLDPLMGDAYGGTYRLPPRILKGAEVVA